LISRGKGEEHVAKVQNDNEAEGRCLQALGYSPTFSLRIEAYSLFSFSIPRLSVPQELYRRFCHLAFESPKEMISTIDDD
jgi:hypothetical protein